MKDWLTQLQQQWQSAGLAAAEFPESKLCRIYLSSPWAAQKLLQQASILPQISSRLECISPPKLETLQQAVATTDLDTGLRQFRNREILRIIWRDQLADAELTEVLADLSTLAEICLQFTLETLQQELIQVHGQPQSKAGDVAELVVLAMGKLGGGELNLSSDIDVVFVQSNSGQTTGNSQGGRVISNEQFFNRLAQGLIKSLAEIKAEGFVFRVDTRLRPYGKAGPLVPTCQAMLQYYQREGRDWERYALIKARPVAGNLKLGSELLQQLRPFIYRRYLDYGAIESLREMHQLMRKDTQREQKTNIDLKRGRGGIREAEFFVQSYQLLRGGRQTQLQGSSFISSLAALQEASLISPVEADTLLQAYSLLRQLENRLQALHDQQTHHLPDNLDDQQSLCLAARYTDWHALTTAVEQQQSVVASFFDSLFSQTKTDTNNSQERYLAFVQADWQGAGIEFTAAEASAVQSLLQQLLSSPMSQRTEQRSQALLQKLLSRNAELRVSADVWQDLIKLMLAVKTRSAYLALLVEHPNALDRLLNLFARSHWLAEEVIRYPVLLDDLIDPKANQPASAVEQAAALEKIKQTSRDQEEVLENFNQYKRSSQLRIAVAELSGELSSRQAQQHLSRLAECLIQASLNVVADVVKERHGELPGLQWAVLAYGSLGAREMNYASDLDLVFLYQITGADVNGLQSDGKKPLAAEQYVSRIGQRLIAFLTTLSSAGRLYSVDSRLRPNGGSGTLVSSMSAFAKYQHQHAWLWERQALIRARAVSGNSLLCAKFEDTRIEILLEKQLSGHELRLQIVGMRQKMRQQLSAKTSYEKPKYNPGGLVDIEFLAQYGLLRQSHSELFQHTDTLSQLRALQQRDFVSEKEVELLVEAWIQLSEQRQRLTLQRSNLGQQESEQTITCYQQVSAIWQQRMLD